jgi:hypothetical protein
MRSVLVRVFSVVTTKAASPGSRPLPMRLVSSFCGHRCVAS